MKKLFYLCFVVIALLATGCKNDDVSPVKQIHLELSHDNISINAGGGSASVTVYCNDSWEVYGSCDWCSPSLRSGMANDEDGTVVNFDAKESYAPREAIFYFMCGEICLELKVTQEQKNVIFADEQNIFNIPASGGVALIEYKTNVLCGVVIPTEAEDWISLTSTRALRDESMGLYIAPNETYDSRSATIMIVAIGDNTLCAEYTINQAQKDVILAVEDNKFIVSSDGGDVNIDFETNVNYKVNIPSNARDWITLVEPTRGVSPHNIVLRVAKNKTYDKRSAVISITKSGASNPTVEYTISQEQNDAVLADENNTFTVPSAGGEVAINYQTNIDCEVIIPEDAQDWITIAPATRGLVSESITLNITENTTYSARTAVVKVVAKDNAELVVEYTINQEQNDAILSDENNTFTVPSAGGEVAINYQTNIDCEVIIPEDAQDWITIAPATRGLVSESITLNIAENTTYSARTTVIKVVAKDNAELVVEYTINQEQNDAVLVDGNNTFTVPGIGGSVLIKYQANVDCEVIIPDEAQDWVTIAPATRGLVSESITLNIAENTTYSARTAVIKVVAKDNAELVVEYTINQEQNDAILADENNTFTVPSAGGEVAINYQTNIDCEVIIPKDAQSWITIAPATRGLVSESITLNIAENTTYSARTAVIKVVAKDNAELAIEYTINQEQNDAVLADGNTEFNIDGREQQITIEHKANVDCEVIIPDEAQDWVTIVPATRGLVTYNTTLNIAENNSGEERSCVVKVTSQGDNELSVEYTIIQKPRYYLYYTSNDGKIVNPYDSSSFGATILSNTYVDGVGVIEFDAPIATIGNYAFYECKSLTSVTIPDSVTEIGDCAFFVCRRLTSVNIPDSVTTIGYQAFYDCSSLERVTIPDSVTSIGGYTFYGCGSLTSVTIPDSVTTIGNNAFAYCSSLTSVTIGDSVTSIGETAFRGCSSLQEFKGKIASEDCRCLIIDGTLYAFAPAGLTEYTIPDSVTTIGLGAFYYCTSLTSVTIPDSVTEIGSSAFAHCDSLTSVTIPDSVTTIGSTAFYGCTSELIINSKIVENNYTSKPGWLNGAKFTKLTIGDSVTSIGDYAFYSCSSLTSVTIGNSVTMIGESAFESCSSLTSVTIPNSVTKIEESAFYGCTGELIINSKIVETDYAYYYPSYNGWLKEAKFTKLTIGDSVTKIGNRAFYLCSSLTSVTIPDSVTTIGNEAFSGCRSFTSVTIPDSVTTIGNYAFSSCESLTSVYCKATTPPAGGYDMFDYNASYRTIYVPMESVKKYKSASYWSDYKYDIFGYNF